MDVSELTDEELKAEYDRLAPFKDEIWKANKAWQDKREQVENDYQAGLKAISDLEAELRKAENAFQPTAISGRLAEVAKRIGV